jgi:hypothetical protein
VCELYKPHPSIVDQIIISGLVFKFVTLFPSSASHIYSVMLFEGLCGQPYLQRPFRLQCNDGCRLLTLINITRCGTAFR